MPPFSFVSNYREAIKLKTFENQTKRKRENSDRAGLGLEYLGGSGCKKRKDTDQLVEDVQSSRGSRI